MLQASNLTKRFDRFTALDHITCTIPDGCVYGMVGSNGAGKSTFLRTVCGIYRPDEGTVLLDGQPVYNNPAAKGQLMMVPDELYFLPNATVARMQQLYQAAYPQFDVQRYALLINSFRLPYNKPISTFSKGMKRLTATALTLASCPRYVFFDETMDGLDPIMRHVVKSMIADDVVRRQASAVVVSHSLRELEDMCDQLALLHSGGIVLEKDVSDLKTALFKIQVAFDHPFSQADFPALSVAQYVQHGLVATMIVAGDREQTSAYLRAQNPLLLEILPLSLEEVFTYEMQMRGYDFNTILEGLSHEKDVV